jgi:catechol 2,3-dioxygenase-like lactoylglutathione lyase family enzyme
MKGASLVETKTLQASDTAIPTPIGLVQISVPTRDVAQSTRFYAEILQGEVIGKTPIVKVQLGNFVVGLGPQAAGATAPHAEYPHYAFTVPAEDFVPLKQRLEAYGVPTHEPWTRAGAACALMYFRDPSGNQWELYCPSGFTALPLRIGSRAGGDYVIPFPALVYDALTAPNEAGLPNVRAADFNHMTIPVRDHEEGKRFFMAVFGGKLTNDNHDHKTVQIGRSPIGMAPFAGGWTAPDALYPYYTLRVRAEDLLPLQQRLESFGVPTHEIITRTESDAATYFRDPSGNLWELACETGFAGPARRVSDPADPGVDVHALSYDRWNDPGRN